MMWPLQKFDERYICMAECYRFKEIEDIDRNLENNFSLGITMPKYHTDVFWDLGVDINSGSSFKVAQKNLLNQIQNTGNPTEEDKSKSDAKPPVSSLQADMVNLAQEESQQIHKIREIINAFPLEKEQEGYDRHLVQ